MKKQKKLCQVCDKLYCIKELYPVGLIRHTVLKTAKEKYPDLDEEGVICYTDLRRINALYFEEVLKEEKGALTHLEEDVLHSLREQEVLSENINLEFEDSLTFGERLADKIASFGGSWTFILIFGVIVVGWMGINTYTLLEGSFDPYPYILLNLVLSCVAALQAPIIMMSQNRHSSKDRLSQEKDYKTNLKSELQIRQLNARLDLFMRHHWQKMHELTRIQEEIVQDVEKKLG